MYHQAAALVWISDWIIYPSRRNIKPEVTHPKEGIHNYLWIKKSFRTIQRQDGIHTMRDGLLRIQGRNRISMPVSLLTSPIDACCDVSIINKTDYINYEDMLDKQGESKILAKKIKMREKLSGSCIIK